MSESSEIIRNEFSMCENPLDVLICQTCPEKEIENEVSVPTVVVIPWCSRNEFSQCEFLRSLRPYHPLGGVSLRIADVVASCRNFQCGPSPSLRGGLGGPWPPPWRKFLYGGKGGPLQKGVILGNFGGLGPPHGDLPATGLMWTATCAGILELPIQAFNTFQSIHSSNTDQFNTRASRKASPGCSLAPGSPSRSGNVTPY